MKTRFLFGAPVPSLGATGVMKLLRSSEESCRLSPRCSPASPVVTGMGAADYNDAALINASMSARRNAGVPDISQLCPRKDSPRALPSCCGSAAPGAEAMLAPM